MSCASRKAAEEEAASVALQHQVAAQSEEQAEGIVAAIDLTE